MKTMLSYLILIIAFSSCKKNCELPKQIIGNGLIINNALVSHPITTSDMRSKSHIVKSDSENVLNLQVSLDNGLSYDSIDFNKYTLLGHFASGGCNVVFDRNVTVNDAVKTYIYKIKVNECGNCKKYWESMNWILIPKILSGYSVEFKVE